MSKKKRYAEKYCEDCGAIFPIPEMHKLEKDGKTIGWRCSECQKVADKQSNDTGVFLLLSGVTFFVSFTLVGWFIAANWFTLILCAVLSLCVGVSGVNSQASFGRTLAWVISCGLLPFGSLAAISGGRIDGFIGLAVAFFWARYLYKTRAQTAKVCEDEL
ncbi:MAG: hypothetical protein GJ676_02400 [Rhodobacteraceae bacterium]|nr:hypothetical protein [Paracoccaceae bacterium]